MVRSTGVLAILFALVTAATAQPSLPRALHVDRERLHTHCRQLLEVLDELKAPLPADTRQALQAQLQVRDNDAEDFAAGVQKLLDPHCLIAVSINPESRVKALRGPAAAMLRERQNCVLLIKVVNEAGVTAALKVSGPELRSSGQVVAGQWLEARMLAEPPLKKTLSGNRLEYVLLRLRPHENGKREATLKFDVGQGTQDLGFRAEVPVLFTVR